MRFKIPSGCYCDNCTYWKYISETKLNRNQDYGFEHCKYSDECSEKCWTNSQNSCKNIVIYCEYLDLLDIEQDTLLWDKCKECGVKDK